MHALLLIPMLVQAQTVLYEACKNSSNIIDIQQGSIVDNLGTGYATNTLCEWKIQSSSNHVIKVSFTYFKTECGYDYLTVYDDENDTALARLCGFFESPPVILSTGNRLTFQFTTDAAINFPGFKMDFTLVNQTHPCSYDSDCLNGGTCVASKCSCDKMHRGLLCESRFAGFDPYTPREMHQATYDPATDSAFISFGIKWGSPKNEYIPLADLIQYSFSAKNWTLINPVGLAPSHRYAHFAWMHDSQLHVYGGIAANGMILNDLWRFNYCNLR
jgi:hypothetical protein